MSLEGKLALVTGAMMPHAIAFVTSDKAADMTGAVLNMMGGLDLFVF